MSIRNRLRNYYFTAIVSLIFALVGFSYNAWRLEVTEDNSNVRTASFEVLLELAALEQLVYSAHYDKDEKAGNPRMGWIMVGLVVDLSSLVSISVQNKAHVLRTVWQENWQVMAEDRGATDGIVSAINEVRVEIKSVLRTLQ
ncbi:MAG: hypothetical protein GY807_22980 [Gammaproteobacteria bacterium]|nr:hypothetical protein [Gammaproteobacteria bacterium]